MTAVRYRSCPHQLTSEQIAAVEQLRRQRQTGPAIARTLGMALSSVGLVLHRLGLNRLDRLEPRPPVIRYERQRPGEMLHLDIKSLGASSASATASAGIVSARAKAGRHAYSPAWVEKFVAAVNDDAVYAKIIATKLA